jgi:hypothetical protein
MNKISEFELWIGISSICGVLAIISLVLKITGLVPWEWWVVLLPIWGPPALIVFTMLLLLFISIFGNIIKGIFSK